MNDKIKAILDNRKNKVVHIDLENKKVSYSEKITKPKIESLGNEEIIRAYLVDKLVNELGYNEEFIELEKCYTRDSIGRTKQKNKDDSARVDIIVKDKHQNPFLYIELKASDKFEDGHKDIKGQLFELSDLEEKQYKTKVKYLVYYSLELSDELADRLYLIEKESYQDYDKWSESKDKTFGLEIPYNYGKPKLKERIKDKNDTNLLSIGEQKMSEIRRNIHNVLWSSGVEDNVAYVFLVKYLLTKIYDEDETLDGEKYQCQIFDKDYVNEANFFERINNTYKESLRLKLNYTDEDLQNVGAILNTENISIQSLYFLVKELQNYSFSKSIRTQKKDILGHFFEETNRKKFKQSEGQFFTTTNVVNFLIYALGVDKLAIEQFEKDYTLPYIIDPSTGSGTFLIEAMKIITKEFKKYDFKLNNTKKTKLNKLFPNEKPNDWAEEYIYGMDNSYSLTVSTKVNMILHGDGSSSTFKDNAISNLQKYKKYTGKKISEYSTNNQVYKKINANIAVNEQFDIVISNPPFSVNSDESKEELNKYFLFGNGKSENLFIERYYQLLKDGGRLGVVLPESVFDTLENKYIRLFLFKYFKIKAVISLPAVTFEPFTSTKTSILLAQKKMVSEVERWDELWDKHGANYLYLKTRCENLVKVYIESADRIKFPSIKILTPNEEKYILHQFLKENITHEDIKLDSKDIVIKYQDELKELFKIEKDTEIFKFYNAWWVFGEVAKELDIDYDIFMAEAENVGYKRTTVNYTEMPNDLFDLEYAPKILFLEEVKEYYINLITPQEKYLKELQQTKKDIKSKCITKQKVLKKEKDKTKKTSIKKIIENYQKKYSDLLQNIEVIKNNISSLNAEKLSAIEIHTLYYTDDIIKNEYYDRIDEKLIEHFKTGIMKRWLSHDIVLRKDNQIKILDSLRADVKWG